MADPAIPSLVRAFFANQRPKMGTLEQRAIATICTSFESYNHKRALLLCDQRLKAVPGDGPSLALRALALYMSARPLPTYVRQDILTTIETLKIAKQGAALGDADVLLVVTHVLRGLGQGDDALELLSQAAQKFPDNEELSMEAFLAYVRGSHTQKAQQLSLRMSQRFSKDDRYLWWSLLSTILFLRNLSTPLPQANVLLSSAERQLATRYSDSANAPQDAHLAAKLNPKYTYTTADEFHVVTRLLELRAQYAALQPTSETAPPSSALVLPSLPPSDAPLSPAQALLAHFASPTAEKWCDSNLGFELWKREAMLRYGSVEGKEWVVLWQRLGGALENGDTNWHTVLYLIRAAVSLAADSSAAYFSSPSVSNSEKGQPTSTGLDLLSRSRDLFRRLATDSPRAKVERGFVLGLLEIARETRSRKWEEEQLLPLVEEYFDRFASKMCCFDDLGPYLAILTSGEASPLREKLSRQAEDVKLTSPADATRCINALKVARYLSDELNAAVEAEAAQGNLRRYFEALPLGRGLPSTELQPADDFAFLACQAVISAYHLSHDRSYLERALFISETALQNSKQKYQLRILTSNLYRLLGAPSLSLGHFRTFGVKNIQHDTLSHLISSRGATFAIEHGGKEGGVFEQAAETERWHRSGVKESQDMVAKALNYNTYSKACLVLPPRCLQVLTPLKQVEDFTEFRHRLEKSLQKSLVTVEMLRMRVLRGVLDEAGIEAGVAAVEQLAASEQAYSDNRDYKTLPSFQRKDSHTVWEQTEMGVRQDAAWLRLAASAYSRFLRPSVEIPLETELPSSVTRSEAALLRFSAKAQAVLVADLDRAAEAEQAGLAFFKEQLGTFVAAAEDTQVLPWELLQIAEVALEAFSLVELGIDQRLAEMAAGKLPDQPRHTKRLRAFRANARDLVRSVGAKLTAYSKKVAKERPKIVAAVVDLQRFEELNEDRITNLAHALVESRRSAAETLGQAIHRRCVK
ncbi:hypothetical protein JCM11641_003737 [Rhodosporidiobolus odoratus]